MFTGIVEEAGIVERIKPAAKSIELTVRANATGHGLKPGGSLAVNGCCLTAVNIATRENSSPRSSICCRKRGGAPICNSRRPVHSLILSGHCVPMASSADIL